MIDWIWGDKEGGIKNSANVCCYWVLGIVLGTGKNRPVRVPASLVPSPDTQASGLYDLWCHSLRQKHWREKQVRVSGVGLVQFGTICFNWSLG